MASLIQWLTLRNDAMSMATAVSMATASPRREWECHRLAQLEAKHTSLALLQTNHPDKGTGRERREGVLDLG